MNAAGTFAALWGWCIPPVNNCCPLTRLSVRVENALTACRGTLQGCAFERCSAEYALDGGCGERLLAACLKAFIGEGGQRLPAMTGHHLDGAQPR